MLLDEFLPRYDVSERHAIEVRATVAEAYEALFTVDFAESGLLRVLLAVRRLPALLMRRRDVRVSPSRVRMTLASLEPAGFIRLATVPQSEVVVGIEGRFWALDGGRCSPDRADFTERGPLPGTARGVWNFSFTSLGDARTRVATETRVLCADASTRRRFLPYWLLIRAGSGLIRRAMLRLLRDEAERRHGEQRG